MPVARVALFTGRLLLLYALVMCGYGRPACQGSLLPLANRNQAVRSYISSFLSAVEYFSSCQPVPTNPLVILLAYTRCPQNSMANNSSRDVDSYPASL